MIQINPSGLPGQISPLLQAAAVQTSPGSFTQSLDAQFNVPTSMEAVFQEASRTYDIPPAVLKAVAKAESNFNPNAKSHCGAMGVMQLMPATARSLGVSDPWNARQNIMGGSKYLRDMLNKYDGNLKLALAAYNAGSGNVDKYGGVPPFAETQNYVKKIFGFLKQPEMALTIPKQYQSGNGPSSSTRLPYSSPAFGGGYGSQDDNSDWLMKQIMNFDNFTEDDYLLLLEMMRSQMNTSLAKSVVN